MKTTQFKTLNFQELERFTRGIFDHLDVLETTRKDYSLRVKYFLNHIRFTGLDRNSFINFKIRLRNQSNFSVSTNSTLPH